MMNKIMSNKKENIANQQQVVDFFCKQADLEKLRSESRKMVMEQELNKIIKGKNILVLGKK